MTEAEALEILKKHDIHRGYYDTQRLFLCRDEEVLHGEQIGEIAANIIYLSDYIPSVIGKSYLYVHSTPVHLSSPDAPALLDRLLDLLEASAERYDEETRRERVSVIHQYFNNKRISAERSQTEMTV